MSGGPARRHRPTSVQVSAYVVGFGDSTLLRFTYARRDPVHVLVDLGTAHRPGGRPVIHLDRIAEDVRGLCGRRLDVVVASSRRREHIAGFAGRSGEIVEALRPAVVVVPAPLAADGPARDLEAVRGLADHVRAALPALEATAGVTRTVVRQLRALAGSVAEGDDLDEAVERLESMGDRLVRARAGDDLGLDDVLPGVDLEVLAPAAAPSEALLALVEETRPAVASRRGGAPAPGPLPPPIFPAAATAAPTDQSARWLIPRIDRMRAEELLALARTVDATVAASSLALLVGVDASRLLLAGDAGPETWHDLLVTGPDRARLRQRLRTVKLYKVGRRGSAEGTPPWLWDAFGRLGPPGTDRMVSVLSTGTNEAGTVDHGTKVPAPRLVTALADHTELVDTSEGETGQQRHDVVVPLRGRACSAP